MANTPETVPVKLELDVPDFQYRRIALDFAIQFNPRSLGSGSVVTDAAAFEDYLRNGAAK